jgi:hypothetical protein
MSIRMPRGGDEEFLKTARSYLAATSIHQKNELIQARLEGLEAFQKKFNENKTDSMNV